jgi:hypothetical protein
MVSPEYLHFAHLIITAMGIGAEITATDNNSFDIELEDSELAFKLQLQDFDKIWNDTIHGGSSLNYQFEMLDMHTAKIVAQELREKINI